MYIYTTAAGDTLSSIARRTGVPQSLIAAYNSLMPPYSLTPGQALLIPNGAGLHTVRAGESVYTIAARYGLSAARIWQLNPPLGGSSELYAGQTLVISLPGRRLGRLTSVGYAYPFIDPAILRTTLPYLSYLAIFSYGFRSDGSLVVPDDAALLSAAAEYCTRSMLVLTSLGDDGRFSTEVVTAVLNSDTARRTLIENLVETALMKGYAAVSSDLEYIAPTDEAAYNRFISELETALDGIGVTLDVSLAPKSSGDMRGLLYEAIDYPALGASADSLLLMTYEWGYTYSEPRAVAPINLVSEVVDYAVSVIPPEKLRLGVPNYGYDWQLPWVEGTPARTIGNREAAELAVSRGAPIEYDQTAATPFFTYTAEDGGLHEVWFEDARSVSAKLQLAASRSLGGIGVWQIMRWFPQLWLTLAVDYEILR